MIGRLATPISHSSCLYQRYNIFLITSPFWRNDQVRITSQGKSFCWGKLLLECQYAKTSFVFLIGQTDYKNRADGVDQYNFWYSRSSHEGRNSKITGKNKCNRISIHFACSWYTIIASFCLDHHAFVRGCNGPSVYNKYESIKLGSIISPPFVHNNWYWICKISLSLHMWRIYRRFIVDR